MLAYAWLMLAANCVLLGWLVEDYFGGRLHGTMVVRYAVGILLGFVLSGILIRVAKSE